jgi:L-ascorbate metabolism protein UlaG (beta-lactamase superfamily)
MSELTKHVHWLGHASIKITGEKTIYIDPFEISGGEPADLILITHDHYDHLSPKDVAKIRTDKTVVVVPSGCRGKISGKVEVMSVGEKKVFAGISVEAVPAYNIGKDFHPRLKGGLGYVVTANGIRIYQAGDTDRIPEMKSLKNIDVAILPVGGTYTMNPREAAEAADDVQPKVAIPFHYGAIVGSSNDAETFKKHCTIAVEILRKE